MDCERILRRIHADPDALSVEEQTHIPDCPVCYAAFTEALLTPLAESLRKETLVESSFPGLPARQDRRIVSPLRFWPWALAAALAGLILFLPRGSDPEAELVIRLARLDVLDQSLQVSSLAPRFPQAKPGSLVELPSPDPSLQSWRITAWQNAPVRVTSLTDFSPECPIESL